ncbi:energy transducer TonB [Crocosphaera sp. XPORK-15E]|uniref:energy transducer TonB n=1 Tax=Crocosphaera sp. XPORK-15E TaxID=3110247 RepID=UPI002B213529|nr:energy transducer TonB [Crocosphaera sp. XPORK-15E]MEA5532415.1 energy transducer TonB [Crocosphaera sp. XPORK-15E]
MAMSSPSLIQPLPIRVFNSNLLSTFTSVGLHGLALFLVVPYLTNLPTGNGSDSAAKPKNVNVIELSPAEQNRLPDQSSGSLDMPEFPNTALGDVPVLDSPNFAPSLPAPLSNLPAPPSLPALPPLSSYGNYSRIPMALPPRSIPITPPPNPSILRPPTPKTELSGIDPQTNDPRASIPFDRPSLGQGPQDDFFGNPNGTGEIATNTSSSTGRNNIAENLQNGTENLAYNPQGTERQEARRKDLEWMQQTGVTLKPGQMMTIRGTYPRAACNAKLEGSAVYNVQVNAQGQLAQPPFMTKSSGYPILNNQGLQDVRSQSFSQPTRVTVTFQPDSNICPSIARTEPPQTPALPGNDTEKSPVTPIPIEVRRDPPVKPIPSPEVKPPIEPAPIEVRRDPPVKPIPSPEVKPPIEPVPIEVRRDPPVKPIPSPEVKPPVEPAPIEVRREPPVKPIPSPEVKPPVEPAPVEVRRYPPPQPVPSPEIKPSETPAPPTGRKTTPEPQSTVPAPPTARKEEGSPTSN